MLLMVLVLVIVSKDVWEMGYYRSNSFSFDTNDHMINFIINQN